MKDRSISFDVLETIYRQRGYLPQFDELPWQEDPSESMGSPALKPRAPYRKRP